MNSLKEQAIAAEESGDSTLAFELWGNLSKTDTKGVASLKYGALAIELEKWEIAEGALTEASRLRPRASIVMALLGGAMGTQNRPGSNSVPSNCEAVVCQGIGAETNCTTSNSFGRGMCTSRSNP